MTPGTWWLMFIGLLLVVAFVYIVAEPYVVRWQRRREQARVRKTIAEIMRREGRLW